MSPSQCRALSADLLSRTSDSKSDGMPTFKRLQVRSRQVSVFGNWNALSAAHIADRCSRRCHFALPHF
jgi:hypothetical protein